MATPNIAHIYNALEAVNMEVADLYDRWQDKDMGFGTFQREWTALTDRVEVILLDAQQDLRTAMLDGSGEDGEYQQAVNYAYHAWNALASRFSTWIFPD